MLDDRVPLPDAASIRSAAPGWMGEALDLAREALAAGEVPVGALVIRAGSVIARARNEREATADPGAHAELLALRRASALLGRWRLDDCLLVSTLEPCGMCAGALVQARVGAALFGAFDPRAGALGSRWDFAGAPDGLHRFPAWGGIEAEASAALLRRAFARGLTS